MLSQKNRSLAIKILIILVAYGFIVYKIREAYTTSFTEPLNISHPFTPFFFILLFILMIINWALEAIKWQTLVQPFQKIKFIYSFQSVLAGITIGLLTPKRIGDIGGRCLMLKKGNRQKGMFGFIVNSIIQTGVTTFFGFLALLLFFHYSLHFSDKQYFILLFSAIFILSVTTWIISHLSGFMRLIQKIPFINFKESNLNFTDQFKTRTILKIFSLGVLRYMVFTIQFLILLRLFGIHLSTLTVFMGVGLTYFLMTFIPLSSIAELGVRGSVAVFIFGMFSPATASILLATFSLWIINLAVPAAIGSIIIYRSENFNFNKRPLINIFSRLKSAKKLTLIPVRSNKDLTRE